MEPSAMGTMAQRVPNALGLENIEGLTLEQLDKCIQGQGQEDILTTYLGWLQGKLNVWDLSDYAVLRPQLKSWADSLRLHGLEDQDIFKAFQIWKTDEIANDACSARRFLVAENELCRLLKQGRTNEQTCPEVEQDHEQLITARDDQIIDVSSGTEDSEIEFLGWRDPNKTCNATGPVDSINTNQRRISAVNKDFNTKTDGSTYGGHDVSLNSAGAIKKFGNNQHKGPPPKGYICDRCQRKGHHKEECPTNLDPSYDVVPTGAYQCRCCNAYKKHLTTLCPQNRNFNSLTQQRIRAGVNSSDPDAQMGSAHYRSGYSTSRKRAREDEHEDESYGDVDNMHIHETRLALMKLSNDLPATGEVRHEARRKLSERPKRHLQSSQSDKQKGQIRGSHYSPPPAKRRQLSQGEQSNHNHQSSRRRRVKPPSNGNKIESSTELLPQLVNHKSEKDGRLSYWDDAYDEFKTSEPSSSSKRPTASESWPTEGPEAELRLQFPDADALWVSGMASFAVDKFFEELDSFMEDRAAGVVKMEVTYSVGSASPGSLKTMDD